VPISSPEPGLTALREGRGFADLSAWRMVTVAGTDGRGWLNDLISADIAGLEPGTAKRSLLLTPTGRIRADFTVTPLPEALLLVQDLEQPAPIDELLAPYVLSSDVQLSDRTGHFALYACPGVDLPDDVPAVARWRPSALGPGTDVLVEGSERAMEAGVGALLAAGLVPAGLEELEAWRVEAGIPRYGVDLLEDSLPQEAGLDHSIAYDKGCFLGQEAVAKVRNLGHPPRVLLAAGIEGPVAAGDTVVADGRPVGIVTSATPRTDGGTAAIVRIPWSARTSRLATPDGTPIRPGRIDHPA
jgi:tRNA-modifying protein YgfZ